MSGDDARSFDLIDRPWILARTLEGDVQELSLTEVIGRAHELQCLMGELPTQMFALTRLLLAILHRAVDGPRNVDHWEELWHAPELPVDLVADYLDLHRDRFDLLHPVTPFMQVADLHTAKDEFSELSKLIADVPNGRPFFSARMSRELCLDFGEAARWVVHCHAFDPSGIKSGAVGDPRVKGGKGYPIGTGWSGYLGGVLLEGGTLRESLLLNLMPLATAVPGYAGRPDHPVWERPAHDARAEAPDAAGEVVDAVDTDPGDRSPTGQLDLYTWQSRRIRLVWRGDLVIGALVCNGDRITPQNRHHLEPHTGWRRSEPQEKKLRRPVVYMPRVHQPQRALWRGLESLLPAAVTRGQGEGPAAALAPGVLQWLGELAYDILGSEHLVRIRAVGMTYGSQNSVTDDVTDDILGLRTILLSQQATGLAYLAVECVAAAEGAARALGGLGERIAKAQGGEGEGPRLRAIELAVSELDGDFRSWLEKLNPSTDAVDAQVRWHRRVRDRIESLGRDEINRAPMTALTGRVVNGHLLTSAHAEARFYRDLRGAIPMAFERTLSQNGSPQ